MLNHLGACTLMMLHHHKHLVSGPCMKAFKDQLQEPFVWHRHQGYVKEYQKGSDVLSHINYGMYGCWQPALELGLVFVVHIRVPQFGAVNKHDEAKRAVYQALADQRKLNVWNAILDMHCSDIDGQRKKDFQHNTHGCIVMCKFMVNASDQLAGLEVIARGCDSKNPFTHAHTHTHCTSGRLTCKTMQISTKNKTMQQPKLNQNKPTPSFTMVLSAKVNMCLRTLAKGQCTMQVCHLGLQQVRPRQCSKQAQGLQQLVLGVRVHLCIYRDYIA